jgi:hypothetical protein
MKTMNLVECGGKDLKLAKHPTKPEILMAHISVSSRIILVVPDPSTMKMISNVGSECLILFSTEFTEKLSGKVCLSKAKLIFPERRESILSFG